MGMVMVRVVKHKSYSPCKVPNNLVVSKTCQFKYPVSPYLHTIHYTTLSVAIPERNEMWSQERAVLLEVQPNLSNISFLCLSFLNCKIRVELDCL